MIPTTKMLRSATRALARPWQQPGRVAGFRMPQQVRGDCTLGGVEFKEDLKAGKPKMGVFLNSASPSVAEQFSHLGYDWLLADTQHGPMNPETLSNMLAAIGSGSAKSMVRVGGHHDRNGVQQALDLGADGILIPYINTVEEAKQAISMCKYPTEGTRSVYFPQRSANSEGLLGYVPNANKQVITALQVETHDCIKNIDEIAALPGLDILFLGQNDLCMSMGLFEREYVFPEMYFSKELNEATQKLIAAAQRNNKILGLFLFGTDRVKEFLDKGFTFISIGNDLHHCLTQANAHTAALEEAAGGNWTRQKSGISG
jgi:4-hydroxy-2-oxoheptanedioate aldolase